jgi:hypothetical protein
MSELTFIDISHEIYLKLLPCPMFSRFPLLCFRHC